MAGHLCRSRRECLLASRAPQKQVATPRHALTLHYHKGAIRARSLLAGIYASARYDAFLFPDQWRGKKIPDRQACVASGQYVVAAHDRRTWRDGPLRARRGLHARGSPVPGTFNYRLPLNPRRWIRLLDALEPSLIEAATLSSRPGRRGVSRGRRGIPLIAFYHSDLPHIWRHAHGASSQSLPTLAV